MRYKIDHEIARTIMNEFDLSHYSSFTNTEPSHLCYEYRVETGFSLNHSGTRSELIHLVDTKNEETGKIQTQAYLILKPESFAIDLDENLEDQKDNIAFYHFAIKRINELTQLGLSLDI